MNWRNVAIVALVVLAGLQHVRISDLRSDLAEAGQAASDERVAREAAAREHAEEKAALAAQHAQSQQTLEDTYAKRIADLESRRGSDARELDRLRGTVAAYAATGRRPGETDAAALERANHRLATLGQLLDEGVQLVVESRQLVERRDAEVSRLLEQIKLDRQVCAQERPASQDS